MTTIMKRLFLVRSYWHSMMRMKTSTKVGGCCLLFIVIILFISLWRQEQYKKQGFMRYTYSPTKLKSTFVSYVLYAPEGSTSPVHEICRNNVDLFVNRGVTQSPYVDYYFSLVGNTSLTERLRNVSSYDNVRLVHVMNEMVDILSHMHALSRATSMRGMSEYTMKNNEILDTNDATKLRPNEPWDKHRGWGYDYYILLNCGARGPYFPKRAKKDRPYPSSLWITIFTDPLFRSGAGVVGSTISMECTPHVQSYAMALNATAARFVVRYWKSKVHTATGSHSVTNFVVANTITSGTSNVDTETVTQTTSNSNHNLVRTVIRSNDNAMEANSSFNSAFTLDLTTKHQLIADLEVGMSTALLAQGFPLIALDPHTHTRKFQQQFRLSIQLAQAQARLFETSPSPSFQCDIRRNPVACRNRETDISLRKPSLGCRGVDPCQVMFVKYGGDILAQELVPRRTIDAFTVEDHQFQQYNRMCDW